jgi:hypothetical protein
MMCSTVLRPCLASKMLGEIGTAVLASAMLSLDAVVVQKPILN